MKVLIVSHSDKFGGAARAAYRLHKALLNKALDSQMIVKIKLSDDHTVRLGHRNKLSHFISRLIGFASNKLSRFQKTKSSILHSFNFFGSAVYSELNRSDADVINLHWVNSETLSIKQIANLNKPVVMTLHDMWAFCGSEHLSIDNEQSQFRVGYDEHSEFSDYISGLNLNKYTWKLKKKYWQSPFTIVTPSSWLSRCVEQSLLFRGWEVHTIPNGLDTTVFKPTSQCIAREILNLPKGRNLIGFGAIGGANDYNKGFDLLEKALQNLPPEQGFTCVVVGQSEPENLQRFSHLPIVFLGHVNDDPTLTLFYNAVDVIVVPSRQESFCQAASESLSCGTPVVAFNTTGLADVVEHKRSGYLAEPYNELDFSLGILWSIEHSSVLSGECRKRALKYWDLEVVAQKYHSVYRSVLEKPSESQNQ